jgi:hypothetical protein
MKILVNGLDVGINIEDLKKAIEENKEAFEINDETIVAKTKSENDVYFNNIKKEIINTAFEKEVKSWRDKLGLEFQGKNFENLFSSLEEKHKTEFQKEPSEQLAKANADLLSFKDLIKNLENEKETIETNHINYKNNRLIEDSLLQSLPENLAYQKNDMLLIIKNRPELKAIVENDKVRFQNQNGEFYKNDRTLEPLEPKDVLSKFFSENQHYLKQTQGGAGGTDSSSNTNRGRTTKDFNERMKSENVQLGSMDYNLRLQEAIKNKEIDV